MATTRVRGLRRVVLVGIIFIAAVLAMTFVMGVWPRTWNIERDDGSVQCTVTRGWTLSQVTQACGAPRRVGGQPNLFQGFATFCSAPCEIHGRRLLLYDCDGRVYRVEPLNGDNQGCVLGNP